jgi:hypothetical protein
VVGQARDQDWGRLVTFYQFPRDVANGVVYVNGVRQRVETKLAVA